MAPTIYRDTGYSLTHLIEEIKHGKIALPDIQRPFVWSSAQVRDLFDSLYRGYPVGTLMFWETGVDAGVRQVGGGENDGVARLLIVDGQQRLTSLFAVLTGRSVLTSRYQQKRIRIAFRPEDETFEVTDAAIERNPEYIADITVLWAEKYRSTVRAFLERLGKHRGAGLDDSDGSWSDKSDRLEERIDRVRDLRDFRFQVLELNASAERGASRGHLRAHQLPRRSAQAGGLHLDAHVRPLGQGPPPARTVLPSRRGRGRDWTVAEEPLHRSEPRPVAARRRRAGVPARPARPRLQHPAGQGPGNRRGVRDPPHRAVPSPSGSAGRGP